MAFLYETHLHTCQGSACGRTAGRDYIKYYKDLGYTGIFVTDHFWGGNTAPDRSLPWKEWVNQFCKGYEDAYEEGLKQNFDVFFGWEDAGNGEYLVYGLDKQWLLDHQEITACTVAEQFRLVHAYGGCVIQAHPFRQRDYIKRVVLAGPYCDGIEVANIGNHIEDDIRARHFADEFNLVVTAGSDRHRVPEEGEDLPTYGVALETRLTSAVDFANRILRREKITPIVPESRFVSRETYAPLESFWVGENNVFTPAGRDWL